MILEQLLLESQEDSVFRRFFLKNRKYTERNDFFIEFSLNNLVSGWNFSTIIPDL